jgi:putative ABC transport system ATP-binding protein
MQKSLIRVENVYKTFTSGDMKNTVIEDMNLDIYDHQFTVIMGASGSGKSTLLYLLSGMDVVTKGNIIFDGDNLNKLSNRKISKLRVEKIGFVFQGINLIPHLNILENIVAAGYLKKGDKKNILKYAKELLGEVGLSEQLYKKPSQVSGGQAQRAAIVRALINKPQVLFADEPTGALNSQSGADILDILSNLNEKGQTIVMVTHDTKASIRAERLLYMNDGKIIGELYLGKYNKDDYQAREAKILDFLKERGW